MTTIVTTTLKCDRCGVAMDVLSGGQPLPEGWDRLYGPQQAVRADLCPDCATNLGAFLTNDEGEQEE